MERLRTEFAGKPWISRGSPMEFPWISKQVSMELQWQSHERPMNAIPRKSREDSTPMGLKPERPYFRILSNRPLCISPMTANERNVCVLILKPETCLHFRTESYMRTNNADQCRHADRPASVRHRPSREVSPSTNSTTTTIGQLNVRNQLSRIGCDCFPAASRLPSYPQYFRGEWYDMYEHSM